jgi:hypothetical protein
MGGHSRTRPGVSGHTHTGLCRRPRGRCTRPWGQWGMGGHRYSRAARGRASRRGPGRRGPSRPPGARPGHLQLQRPLARQTARPAQPARHLARHAAPRRSSSGELQRGQAEQERVRVRVGAACAPGRASGSPDAAHAAAAGLGTLGPAPRGDAARGVGQGKTARHGRRLGRSARGEAFKGEAVLPYRRAAVAAAGAGGAGARGGASACARVRPGPARPARPARMRQGPPHRTPHAPQVVVARALGRGVACGVERHEAVQWASRAHHLHGTCVDRRGATWDPGWPWGSSGCACRMEIDGRGHAWLASPWLTSAGGGPPRSGPGTRAASACEQRRGGGCHHGVRGRGGPGVELRTQPAEGSE